MPVILSQQPQLSCSWEAINLSYKKGKTPTSGLSQTSGSLCTANNDTVTLMSEI